MPYTIELSIDLEVTPEVAFDTLCDHDSWPSWMPSASFRPVGQSMGLLHVGGEFRISIERMPASSARVTVVDRAREISWSGGFKGVLWADHAFFFEPLGKGTRVRSVETWSGVIAPLLKPLLKPGAHRVGKAQLAGLQQGALARMQTKSPESVRAG